MGTENNTGRQACERSGASQEDTRVWDFAKISAVLAVVASATYAMGIYAIWIPVATTYTNTTAAWYATSLVNRIVVIIQGANHLLLPTVNVWLWFELGMLITACTVWSLRQLFRRRRDSVERVASYIALPMLYLLIISGWFYVFCLPYIDSGDLDELDPRWIRSGVLCIIGAISVWAFGIYLIGYKVFSAYPYFADRQPLWQGYRHQLARRYTADSRQTLRVAMVLLTGYFFLALAVIYLFQEPSLPRVEMRTTEDDLVTGKLLANSEGYWHIFDVKSGDLITLRDDQVEGAKVRGMRISGKGE
jgi:hypothetical protein